MMETVITIVICTLGTILKGLVRELEELEIGGRADTNQITIVQMGANTESRRLVEIWSYSDYIERQLVNAGVKTHK